MQRNWTNFVLLRHELLVGKDKPETKTFYSLYMHLAPPAWWQVDSSQEPGSGVDVPWLRRWTTRTVRSVSESRLESEVRFQGSRSATYSRYPTGCDPSLVSERYLIRVPEGELSIELDVWNPIRRSMEKRSITVRHRPVLRMAVWIYFPPPPHLDLVCQALEQGKTLFLDGHFLSVANGENDRRRGPVQPPSTTSGAPTRYGIQRDADRYVPVLRTLGSVRHP
jgi:hypothetical protein